MSNTKPHWRTPDDTSDTLPDQLRKALAEADSLLAKAKGGATVRPHWRTPDDTSDELEVGDRIVAICQCIKKYSRLPALRVVTMTVDENDVRDNEDLGMCLKDCYCWIPEAEFLRMFVPEAQQADTPPDAPPWQGQDGWEGKR